VTSLTAQPLPSRDARKLQLIGRVLEFFSDVAAEFGSDNSPKNKFCYLLLGVSRRDSLAFWG
jgi:hypothetical protein